MPKIPQQLIPLPGAEREAKAIAKLFKTQALIGDRATETKVTQRLPRDWAAFTLIGEAE